MNYKLFFFKIRGVIINIETEAVFIRIKMNNEL